VGESGQRAEGVRPAAGVSRWGSVWSTEKGSWGCGCVEVRSGRPFCRVGVWGGEGTEERGGRQRWWSHSMASITNQEGEIEGRLTDLEKGKQSRRWVALHSSVQQGVGGRAGEVRWRWPVDGGGDRSMAALGFNTEDGERGEWASWAKWPHGPDEAGLVREERWTRLQESLGQHRFGPPEK
jgi:hypothetical protein